MSFNLPGFSAMPSTTAHRGKQSRQAPTTASAKSPEPFTPRLKSSLGKQNAVNKHQAAQGDGFVPSMTQRKSGPLLAIIDDFQTPSLPAFVKQPNQYLLEASGNGWVSHGDIVEAHAKLANPGVRVYRLQTPHTRSLQLHTLGQNQSDLPSALKMLKKHLETDDSINAVNISFGLAIPIQRLQEDLNLPDLTAQNIRKYRDIIMQNYDKIQFAPPLFGIKGLPPVDQHKKRYVREAMQLLEEIAQRKAVYISAGNAGPENINILSLVKGVKTVGALDGNRAVAEYSGNNGYVSYWAQSNKHFAAVHNPAGQLTGLTLKHGLYGPKAPENSAFIPRERLQMRRWGAGKWINGLKGATLNPKPLEGTSFASPQVAAQKARQIFWWRKLTGADHE